MAGWEWALLATAGVAAGVINTIAGGGSFLVLPLLMGLGLPAGVANGTVRVGVVLQNVTSLWTFHREGMREWGTVLKLAPATAVGGLAGARLATVLEDDFLRTLFGLLLLLWAVVLLGKPGRFLSPPESSRSIGTGAHLLVFLIGAYSGFVQAGVGFPLMAFLIYFLGFDAVRTNVIKVGVVLVATLVALPVFILEGDVAWREGLVLAAGNMLGGWAGTRWQIRSGVRLIRVVVLVMVAVSGALLLL